MSNIETIKAIASKANDEFTKASKLYFQGGAYGFYTHFNEAIKHALFLRLILNDENPDLEMHPNLIGEIENEFERKFIESLFPKPQEFIANTVKRSFIDFFSQITEELVEKYDELSDFMEQIVENMENVYNETYLWNLRRIKGTKTIFRGPDPKLYKEDDRIFTFLEKNNIKTVIDLRGEYEASSGQDFREELIKRGIEAPVVNLNEPPNTSDSSPGYVKKLTHRSDQIAEMLRYIIKGKGNSLIHCHSGKDRTGVSSALLMKIMGLSDKESIEEYTKTGLDARPTRIIPVLKYLEKQQNGALNYLKHIGLTEEEIEALNKK